MLKLTPRESDLLAALGLRLRQARIARRITQKELAARTGLSRRTILLMEQGDPGIGIGKWVKAGSVLAVEEGWQTLFELAADPFEEHDRRLRAEEKIRRTRVRSG